MITVLSSSFPHPADIGRKVVMAGILRHLCREYGADRVRYILLGRDDGADPAGAGFPVEVVPLAGGAARLPRAALWSLALRQRSLQEAMLFDPAARRRVRHLLADPQTRLVVADTVRVLDYLPPPARRPWRTVLYMDDLYSVRYQRLLDTLAAHPDAPIDALGTFGRFIPRPLHRLAGPDGLQRRLLTLESRLLRKRELAAVRQADATLLINPQEAERLRGWTGSDSVHAMPPLLPAAGPAAVRQPADPPTFVFLGNLTYPANRYALSLFLDRVMPRVRTDLPTAVVQVVGRGADADLRGAAAPFGGAVVFRDFVPDLAGLFAGATALLAPLPYGSGLKLKVVEAMARGLPVIGTPVAFEGFTLVPGRDCLLAGTLDEIPGLMARACQPAVNQALSAASRAAYDRQFGEAPVTALYRRLFHPAPLPEPAAAPVTA